MQSCKLVLFTLLISASWSGMLHATADGPDYYQVTGVEPGDKLNIRAEPSTKGDEIGEIPPGSDCVRNLGCQGGLTYQEFTTLPREQQQQRLKENPRWCKVEYQGTTGWVAGRYLAEGTCNEKR